MSIKTFWSIFIKILGIWLVLDSVTLIPQSITTLSSFIYFEEDVLVGTWLVIGLLLVILSTYIFILRLFVFKTNWIINKLHLIKGFENEKIDINVKTSTVLKISIIVIGGLLFVSAFPQLCREVFEFFQQKSIFRENPSSGRMIFHFFRTLIGYLLMTNSNSVLKFIEQKTDS